MKGATENAKNIIDGLTLDYNKARQTQITNELLEITTAMRAIDVYKRQALNCRCPTPC